MFSLRFFLLVVVAALFSTTLVLGAPSPSPARHGKNVKGLGLPISNPDARDIIAGQYIVVYYNNATDDAVQLHQSSIKSSMVKRGLDVRSRMKTFSISGWRSMRIDADDDGMVIDIASAASVNYVEAVTKVSANDLLSQANAPIGLGRLSHVERASTDYIFDSTAGAGITAYVVDTGIRTTHTEFEDRATFGANFANNVDTDENGHGTHVSGTVGGRTFGVAKSVKLVAVKVLDADGAGTTAQTIDGLEWVGQNVAQNNLAGKAVVNMSLGGPKSQAVNAAIAALTSAGVVCVVAAGNDGSDAANDSPASATSAITVGAISASNDIIASFSNFGTIVDIFAPGVNVLSAWIDSDSATNIISGTSMASPHVAGMAAYLMSLESLTTPVDVATRMKNLADGTFFTNGTKVAVKGAPRGTTTRIAYNGNGY